MVVRTVLSERSSCSVPRASNAAFVGTKIVYVPKANYK